MEKASCCCFTGHRILKVTDELEKSLRSVLVGLIENGVFDYFAGGALGLQKIIILTLYWRSAASQRSYISLYMVCTCAFLIKIPR